MRKLLFAAVLLLASCSKTPQERAQSLVEDYLEQTANDPSSVQDLEVGVLIDEVEKSKNGYDVPVKYASVSYRAKNEYGALVKESGVTVRFDKDVTKILCFDCFGY